jgi:uncharacterized protein (DUF433 family)
MEIRDKFYCKGNKIMTEKERKTEYTEYPHIVKIKDVNGGTATIEGTRIAVWHVVGYYYEVGMSVEEFLADWNYITPAQVFSALAYYHDHKEEIDQLRWRNSHDYYLEHKDEYANVRPTAKAVS